MLRKIGALGAALAALSVAGVDAQEQSEPPVRPNVLVIVTDDQRTGTMGVMPETRRIFGQRGTRFTNAFVTTPLCCPARASIMSGRYAHNHGIQTQKEGEAFKLEQSQTMQRELKAAGYRTGVLGKFLNGWALENSPTYFDEWAIFSHSAPNGYYEGTWNIRGTTRQVATYSTTFLRRQARRFLNTSEETDDQPWLLYVAPAAPHAPFTAEPRYNGARLRLWGGNPGVEESDRSDKPRWVQDKKTSIAKGRYFRREQLQTLMSVDDLVEAVFEELRKLNEDETTLAFFLSDNGFLWGEHGLRQKRYPYVPSVGVPFYVRWPGVVAAGAKDERVIGNIDIAPTVYDAIDLNAGYEVDGRSLLDPSSRDRLLLEFWNREGEELPTWASSVAPDYQYIEYYSGQGVPVESEYYDRSADPWQLVNLLGDEDATNDPNTTLLSLQLSFDRSCEGSDCP